ncbi:tRNA(m(1)G37)methyltransferase [Yamadazyma tenuis]|nr:tRNA(m(1)G37)methyltransferase [Yamadazyma tenuis]
MTELDRSFFQKSATLLVACFPDPSKLGQFVKECKKDILYLPSVKHIVAVGSMKGVLLREDINDLETYKNKLSEKTTEKIKEFGILVKPYEFHMDYNFWRADDILRAVLPENLLDELPTGFAQAGHVAHINLREEFKPYGKLIGQVILDKNSKVETVVDKVDTIDTQFRTFKMKVLAGRHDLVVEQSESGCKFTFDFSKVYWNSRLSTEHDRLISQFAPCSVVGDVFAGVGPFVVPAGKKNVFVLANDLNPESFKYLEYNIKANRTQDFVQSFNLDGRQFIRESPQLLLKWANEVKSVSQKKLIKKRKISQDKPAEYKVTTFDIPKYISNYVMNLPDSALTFLDEFVSLYSRDPEVEKIVKEIPDFKLPIVNVHCFEKFSATEPEPPMEELHRRVHAKIVKLIDHALPFEECEFHLVRKVAPTKPMFCVTFTLPKDVVFRKVE